MLQNSLDRLFLGMAATLHEQVLPALDDRAVAAQVRAMAELLGNLSTRVVWDVGYLSAIVARVQPALVALADLEGAPPEVAGVLGSTVPAPEAAEAARQDVVDRLEALAIGQAWLEGPVPGADAAVAAVTAFADWYLAQEMQRLRSAGFGRPAAKSGRAADAGGGT